MSTFGFSGPIERLEIRVKLFQKGFPALDFDGFNGNGKLETNNSTSKTLFDEITLNWLQKYSSHGNRLFTIVDDEELPEHLKEFAIRSSKGDTMENSNDFVPTDSDYVILKKSQFSRIPINKKAMFILANLGAVDMQDAISTHIVARIILSNNNQLTIEPSLNAENGIELETRFGDFLARISLKDKKEDDDLELNEILKGRASRHSISSLPESETFSVARDGWIESTIVVTLHDGTDFLFDEGLSIEYKLRLPGNVRLKAGNESGRTQRFSCGSDGIINFAQIFEFVFEHLSDEQFVLLMLRIESVDYWGRQYVAGYASCYIPLAPGKNSAKLNCWRPMGSNSLYEQFIGQEVDIDYFAIKEDTKALRAGINGQTSGEIQLESTCISQSRKYMARDVLYQLKYGSKMADMGLRSDFYQRIIKVLMDFEEARAKLLLARGLHKKNTILP